MHLDTVWAIPLGALGAGAAVLALVAGLVRREVAQLQRSLRPLRVRDGRRRGPTDRESQNS